MVYKIITKSIVARLTPFWGELISPLQIAFVPSRRGTDNAIIVQELIRTIRKKKKKRMLDTWQSKLTLRKLMTSSNGVSYGICLVEKIFPKT